MLGTLSLAGNGRFSAHGPRPADHCVAGWGLVGDV